MLQLLLSVVKIPILPLLNGPGAKNWLYPRKGSHNKKTKGVYTNNSGITLLFIDSFNVKLLS